MIRFATTVLVLATAALLIARNSGGTDIAYLEAVCLEGLYESGDDASPEHQIQACSDLHDAGDEEQMALNISGWLHHKNGDTLQAMDSFTKAIEQYDNPHYAYYARATINQHKTDQLDQALTDITQAIELSEDQHADYFHLRGLISGFIFYHRYEDGYADEELLLSSKADFEHFLTIATDNSRHSVDDVRKIIKEMEKMWADDS